MREATTEATKTRNKVMTYVRGNQPFIHIIKVGTCGLCAHTCLFALLSTTLFLSDRLKILKKAYILYIYFCLATLTVFPEKYAINNLGKL